MHIRYNSTGKFYESLTSTGPDVWTELPLDASQISQGVFAPARIPDIVPVGVISLFGGTAAPTGYVLCDGTSYLRAGAMAALFAVIGTAFGAVDGTHFTVPDLRQRVPLGQAAAGTGSVLGATGGAIDHTHTGPSHTHTYTDVVNHTHPVNVTDPKHNHNGHAFSSPGAGHSAPSGGYQGANNDQTSGGDDFTTQSATGITATTSNPSGGVATGTTAASGTGATGTNNPPFQVVNFIIKT